MYTWERTGKTVDAEGTTVIYTAKENPNIRIESRKRKIPHANRSGFWWHTSFFIVVNGEDWSEQPSLARAKKWATPI